MSGLEKLSKAELIDIIVQLRARIEELENRLDQDSSNSSKPPSSDPIWKRFERLKAEMNKKRLRKPGGQKGHKGHKLKKFTKVDRQELHVMNCCPHCSSTQLKVTGNSVRQQIDIPPSTMEITEHIFQDYWCDKCECGIKNEELKLYPQEVQYGPRIKALVSYLNVYQLLPYKRLVELIESMFGHRISQRQY